jgi:hypothetical protein
MVDGHPYKVKVVGSSPTVPIREAVKMANGKFENAES